MATTVELGVNLAANGIGSYFTLDDATKGTLDNATYKLAGDVYVDITTKVREVSTRRGRSRVLEKFTAGIATVVVDNRDRTFDPTYASSPYFGSIVPRKQIRITRDGFPVFTGLVESWEWDNDLSGDATATVRAIDGFAAISQAVMTAGTAVGTTPGARVNAALNDAGWPSTTRNVSTGGATLDSDVIGNDVNVTSYLGKVEASEQGAFFFDKSNIATFLSRTQTQNPTSGNATFGAASIPFVEYQAASLTDELRNIARVVYTAGSVVGGTATATDATSITNFGEFDYQLDTVLSGNVEAQRVADYIVNQYKDPKYRIDSLTVILEALSASQDNQVLDLELADLVSVQVSLPNVNPVGTALSRTLSIDAIEHRIGIDRHLVTFTMSDATTSFVLDSSTFGVLDSSRLGF